MDSVRLPSRSGAALEGLVRLPSRSGAAATSIKRLEDLEDTLEAGPLISSGKHYWALREAQMDSVRLPRGSGAALVGPCGCPRLLAAAVRLPKCF